MQGAYLATGWPAFNAGIGVILGAAWRSGSIVACFMGRWKRPMLKAMSDLNAREYAMFVPLIVLTCWLGVHPGDFPRYVCADRRESHRRL